MFVSSKAYYLYGPVIHLDKDAWKQTNIIILQNYRIYYLKFLAIKRYLNNTK